MLIGTICTRFHNHVGCKHSSAQPLILICCELYSPFLRQRINFFVQSFMSSFMHSETPCLYQLCMFKKVVEVNWMLCELQQAFVKPLSLLISLLVLLNSWAQHACKTAEILSIRFNIPHWIFSVYNCTVNEFKCASGHQCINSYYRCDGVFDCSDRSDERACREYLNTVLLAYFDL